MIDTGSSWAQVGWIEYAYSNRHDFYQAQDATHGQQFQEFPAEPINNTTNYNVMFEEKYLGWMTFRITGAANSQQCASTYNGQYCEWYVPVDFTPDSSLQAGEIHNDADQVPGHYNVPEFYKSAQIWYSSWVNYDGSLFRPQSWMNYAKLSPTWLQISDTAATCQF
ncbi:MAG TPA: hypothetical protein VN193_13825 [Candidatus Angelobacter sp.]|jgi:hypothetical protein|nr:hypothetical protein [Candidatus Angelobacter sp.]